MMSCLKSIVCSLVLLASLSAPAGELFNNSFISFEIPSNWKCKPFDVTWVCHSKLARKQKEAAIIMVAKEAGTLDTLSQYQSFLKNQRNVREKKTKRMLKSKVVHVKQKNINSQAWVDGLHKGSEVPSYFTRYMVTTCCNNSAMKLGILVTLSAKDTHYTKYANKFLKVINSLRVADINKTLKDMKSLGKGENMGNISKYIEEVIAGAEDEVNPEGEGTVIFGMDAFSLSLVGLALLAVLLLLTRKLKKKKQKKSGKKSSKEEKNRRKSKHSSRNR